MLTLDRVTLTQGDFRLDADWTLQAGGLTVVIGPSGGGKSTLLAGIAGFLQPDEGQVRWDGKDLTPLPPGKRPVSMIFQDNNLFPHLTAAQNIGLALRPRLWMSTTEQRQVDDALARVGLTGMGDRKPGALSGGQQSRVALARLLLADRPLVLLDEPFAALGPALKDEMFELVRTLLVDSGKTVLMITHDPEDAKRIAEQTILVADNQASAPQATEALFADPPPTLSRYLGS
jgi:thiamine transport system ATP-binding protein